VEAVVAYCADLNRCYFLPITLVEGRQACQLRLAPSRNNQRALINWAVEYELGAIAQLEERCHGMAEVVGSSPTSSTATPSERTSISVAAHEFRNRFGWYMQCAAEGEPILVTHRGQPRLRLSPVVQQIRLAA
jgi:prevent-host-death family protein